MITVSSSEFQRNIGHYQDVALKQPVVITSNGRERVVMVSADEYRKVVKYYIRESLLVGELSDDELETIANAKMDSKYDYLDAELEEEQK